MSKERGKERESDGNRIGTEEREQKEREGVGQIGISKNGKIGVEKRERGVEREIQRTG